MCNVDIFAKFLQLFPAYTENVSRYSCDGDDSIEVVTQDSQRLTFIYHTDYDWLLLNSTRRVER